MDGTINTEFGVVVVNSERNEEDWMGVLTVPSRVTSLRTKKE